MLQVFRLVQNYYWGAHAKLRCFWWICINGLPYYTFSKFLKAFLKITAQKMKFSIKDPFSKCDQIRRKLLIWSHLLKNSLMEIFIFLCCGCQGFPFIVKLIQTIETNSCSSKSNMLSVCDECVRSQQWKYTDNLNQRCSNVFIFHFELTWLNINPVFIFKLGYVLTCRKYNIRWGCLGKQVV